MSDLRTQARRQGGHAGFEVAALVRVERADRVGKCQSLEVVRDHTACSSFFRMASMPARIRVFTVPSGSSKRCASSLCVYPSKKAASMSCRCSAGRPSSVGQRPPPLSNQYGCFRRLDGGVGYCGRDGGEVDRRPVDGGTDPSGPQAIDREVARHA